MKPKHQRLAYALFSLVLLGLAALLALRALKSEIMFFYAPGELKGLSEELRAHPMRLGGLVERGSLTREGLHTQFRVTDGTAEITVSYQGSLPALFREGQGVVAEGRLHGDTFEAERILAKHDETYMPPDVARKLKASGHWKTEHGAPAP